MEDRFESLIEEVGRVRAELGYPITVTPFPQMVVSQALFNVMGERYANVPDQVIRYVWAASADPPRPSIRRAGPHPRPATGSRAGRGTGAAHAGRAAPAVRARGSATRSCCCAHMPAERSTRCSPPGPALGTSTPSSPRC